MKKRVFIWGDAGKYGNYIAAIQAVGGEVCLSRDLEDADSCGALLLPGGGDLEPWRYGQSKIASRGLEPERDLAELTLLDMACRRGWPVLGICRGLQTINVFFGGTLHQDIPGHTAVEGRDRLHQVRTAPSFLLALYESRPVVNSAHHQAVALLGSGLDALQWTEDGVIEAFAHRTAPIWAVQWHPERLRGPWARSGAADGALLFRAFLAQAQTAKKI